MVLRSGGVADWHLDAVHGTAGAGLSSHWFSNLLGIVNLMTVIPLLPFSFWGGSLADRVSKRKILLITQTLMSCQAFILAALTWTGLVRVWHVYLMALILGYDQSSRYAPTPIHLLSRWWKEKMT